MKKYLLSITFFLFIILGIFIFINYLPQNEVVVEDNTNLLVKEILNKSKNYNPDTYYSISIYPNEIIQNIKIRDNYYIVNQHSALKIDNNKTILLIDGETQEFNLTRIDLLETNLDTEDLFSDEYDVSFSLDNLYYHIVFKHKDNELEYHYKINKYNYQLKEYQEIQNETTVIKDIYYSF